GILAFPSLAPRPARGDPDPRPAYVLSAFALLAALILQIKRRALVIDPAEGVLKVLNRLSVFTLHRDEYPLRDLTGPDLVVRGSRRVQLRAKNALHLDRRPRPAEHPVPGEHHRPHEVPGCRHSAPAGSATTVPSLLKAG